MATATVGSSETVGALDSLITRLEAAQCAFNRRQPVMAIQLLDKFVHEVQAHAGRRIDFDVANYLAAHAQTIMDSILLMGVRPVTSRQQFAAAGSVRMPAAQVETRQSARASGDLCFIRDGGIL